MAPGGGGVNLAEPPKQAKSSLRVNSTAGIVNFESHKEGIRIHAARQPHASYIGEFYGVDEKVA